MKARIPMNSREKKQLKQELRWAAQEEYEAVRQDETRRMFKLFCYVLHSRFGFRKRCMDVIADVEKTSKERREDPVFWEHIDRYVIDQMGMQFDRENVDIDGELLRGK